MIFSDTKWLRLHAKKIDVNLRKELLNCYRHSRFTPCFFQKFINNFRYHFKKVDVIVRYTDTLSMEDKSLINCILSFSKRKKINNLEIINSLSLKLSPRKINKMLEIKSVKAVYLNKKYKALLDVASSTLKATDAWDNAITGKEITVAVIDTGIYPHDDLIKPKNRILGFKDFINGRVKLYDDNGHGTHVAGNIASNGWSSGGLYKAPAYDSLLVGVKALDKFGTGSLSNIISAIEWCIKSREKYNIRVICMSLGSEANSSYKDDLLCEAVEIAWNSGIVVCAAAGNEGPEYGTISSPGIDPLIITVGSVDDNNTLVNLDDTIANFSSRGPTVDGLLKPDVVSPGVNIVSLRAPGSYIDKRSSSLRIGDSYISLSGTSMATPLCCSSIALLLEKKPQLTPDQVKEVITHTAADMGYDKNTQGYGFVNISDMLYAIEKDQEVVNDIPGNELQGKAEDISLPQAQTAIDKVEEIVEKPVDKNKNGTFFGLVISSDDNE